MKRVLCQQRTYAGFRRPMEHSGPRWCRSCRPLWRTVYGPTNGAWRALRRALCRRKACVAVARSLKMNVDGAADRDTNHKCNKYNFTEIWPLTCIRGVPLGISAGRPSMVGILFFVFSVVPVGEVWRSRCTSVLDYVISS